MPLKPKEYWCARNLNHVWTQSRRALRDCPLCRSELNSLAARFPDIASEWHPSKNGIQTPFTVTANSKNYAWWQCRKDLTHVFEARIRNRTVRRNGCLYCAGKRVTESNSLAVLRPDIAAEWHPRLNKNLRADQVSCGSGRKVWWLCKRTGIHEWERSIGHITSRNDGCPVCRRVSEGRSLQSRFPEIAAEWHPGNRYLFPMEDPDSRIAADRIQKNRRIEPSDVAAFSNEYIWWQCKLFVDHVWNERVSRRTSNGSGCPKCKELRFASENALLRIVEI